MGISVFLWNMLQQKKLLWMPLPMLCCRSQQRCQCCCPRIWFGRPRYLFLHLRGKIGFTHTKETHGLSLRHTHIIAAFNHGFREKWVMHNQLFSFTMLRRVFDVAPTVCFSFDTSFYELWRGYRNALRGDDVLSHEITKKLGRVM